MRFDHMFDDAQTDPHARRFAAQFRAEAIETLEYLFVFRGWNARAMVRDRKAEHRERSTLLFGWPGVFSLSSAGGEEAVSAAFSERHHDFFALRRMFDRIVNEVHE